MTTSDSEAGTFRSIDDARATGSRSAAQKQRSTKGWFTISGRAVSVLTILALLVIWWVAARLSLVSPLFLPGPFAVLRQAAAVSRDGYVDSTLLQHIAASLGRVMAALAAVVLVGVPAGLAMGMSRIAKGILDPVIEFIRPIPPLAYLPLVVIWLGIGEASKVVVIAIAMIAPITIATVAGVRSVPAERVNAARSMGATALQVLSYVVLPNALPSILTGVRIALGAGWSTLVAAELVAATRGLGFMIQSAAAFLVTDVVLLGIVVIALIAFLLELAIRAAERILVPWNGKA